MRIHVKNDSMLYRDSGLRTLAIIWFPLSCKRMWA